MINFDKIVKVDAPDVVIAKDIGREKYPDFWIYTTRKIGNNLYELKLVKKLIKVKKGSNKDCLNCGNSFYIEPWEQKRGKKFCSKGCYTEHKHKEKEKRHEEWRKNRGGVDGDKTDRQG